MDPYDREKTREIWRRVLGEAAEPVRSGGGMTLAEVESTERESAQILRRRAAQACGDARSVLLRTAQDAAKRAKKCALLAFLETGERTDRRQIPEKTMPLPELLRERILAHKRAEEAYADLTGRGVHPAELRELQKNAAENRVRLTSLLEMLM